MTSRPARSSSIPIPRSSTSASPSRNIESVIAMPFMNPARPRLTSGSNFLHTNRSSADEFRGLGVSQGVRGSTSTSITNMSSTRPTARSFTLSAGIPPRGSPRTSTFEPRIIRADTSRSVDPPCLPSSSASPSRTRRASATGVRAPSAQRHPSGHAPPAPLPPPVSFPRPAYLEHSALRHLLQTEISSHLPPSRKTEGAGPDLHALSGAVSPPTDSDDESNVTPPRDIPPAPPATLLYDPILRLPTRWSEEFRNPQLTVSADGRDLTYHGNSSTGEKDAAAARAIQPAPPACGIYYYEVDILSKGQKGQISIGFAARDVRLSRLPGWEKNSWGYHGDDGFSFAAEKNGTPYGPTFGTGDIIGCGIDFTTNTAFYTKNGAFLGPVFENIGKEGDIFPSIGMRHSGEAIRVNFGHDPFKYDIEYHVQQQRNTTWAKIIATPLDPSLIEGGVRGEIDSKVGIVTQGPEALPPSEEQMKGPIDRLVLSYLAHHGYAKTARTFQKQCQSRMEGVLSMSSSSSVVEDRDIDMDVSPRREGRSFDLMDGDIELRTRIVNSVVSGDIDTALSETQKYHPSVLAQEGGLMLFKLKCRKFVELVLEAAEMKKRMKAGDGGEDGMGMDVDDDTSSTIPNIITNGFAGGSGSVPIRGVSRDRPVTPGRAWGNRMSTGPYETALTDAISYGQRLSADYKADDRLEVQAIFKRTFGILAWDDPMEAGGQAAEVAGQEARIVLANELNQAILKSQGRPTHPALEVLYRHTAACITQLGLLGVGSAAFADMPKEFLDA